MKNSVNTICFKHQANDRKINREVTQPAMFIREVFAKEDWKE